MNDERASRPLRLEPLEAAGDGRSTAPSAARNRDEILAVLQRVLPRRGTILELASGTGEHAAHFARHLPDLHWQPSERDAAGLRSIEAWRRHAGLENLSTPLQLDIESHPWPVDGVHAVVAINLAHITPWSTTVALMAGAAMALRPGGVLFVYGAFFRSGHPTAPSNLEFDRELRRRSPDLGVRQLDEVLGAAAAVGLADAEVLDMPHNNLAIVLTAPA